MTIQRVGGGGLRDDHAIVIVQRTGFADATPSMPDETGCNVTISPKSDRCFSGTATSWMLSLPLLPALPLSPSPLPATVKSPDFYAQIQRLGDAPACATFLRIAVASIVLATTIRSYW